MPKLKIPRKSTTVDMTAMCDVAFLLLSFFMLATKFKPQEVVTVTTPSSISQISIPDTSIMVITVDKKNRVFFSIDRKKVAARNDSEARKTLITDMNTYKSLGLTTDEVKKYQSMGSTGQPLAQMKAYLDADGPAQKDMDDKTPGIPTDSTDAVPTNELAAWIRVARNSNPYLKICIKADGDAKYPAVNNIISTLGSMKIFRFNLITNLEGIPPGSPAYIDAQKAAAAKG